MAHGQGGAEIGIDRAPTLTCNHEAPIAAYQATTQFGDTAGTLTARHDYVKGEAGGQGGPECGVEPIAFHPSQDPISSTCGTSHGLGCGSSRGQASVAVAVALRGREGGASGAAATAISSADDCIAIRTAQTGSNGWGVNTAGVAYTLDGSMQAVAVALRGREGGATAETGDDLVMYGVPTAPKQADQCPDTRNASGYREHVIAFGADAGSLAPTLRAMNHASSHANGGGQLAVAVTGEVFHTLRAEGFDASEDGTGRGTGAVAVGVALAIHENQRAEVTPNETAGTVKCAGGKPGQGYPAVLTSMAVRRLTPCECERLMGFPDGYTAIPYRGKSADQCPDGPRYKSLGNSWPVPVVAWIGARIQAQVAVSAQA